MCSWDDKSDSLVVAQGGDLKDGVFGAFRCVAVEVERWKELELRSGENCARSMLYVRREGKVREGRDGSLT